jgi:hypothetical protein
VALCGHVFFFVCVRVDFPVSSPSLLVYELLSSVCMFAWTTHVCARVRVCCDVM